MNRRQSMSAIFRDDAAASLRAAAAHTSIACVNARRAKRGGDDYAVRALAAHKVHVRACLTDAKASRLDAVRRGFRLP